MQAQAQVARPASAAERAAALQQQLSDIQGQQHAILEQIQAALADATQGHMPDASSIGHDLTVGEQIAALSLLSSTRDYVARLKAAAEAVKQLERQIRAGHLDDQLDAEQLAALAGAASDAYAGCASHLAALAAQPVAEGAAPQQLRGLEQQLAARLQASHDQLRGRLSQRIQACLAQCGWPPQLVPDQAQAAAQQQQAPGGEPPPPQAAAGDQTMFSAAQAEATSSLQRLMLALTRLQLASQREAMQAALQASPGGGSGSGGGPSPPLLWLAGELAAPLAAQLAAVFGPSGPGSPGALDTPQLLLASAHRLAAQNVGAVDFLQGVVQALELHGSYHVSVEFTRALREAVRAILLQHKLPEIAAAASRELWLAWMDALVEFEGRLAASGLLGCYWDATDAGDLPVMLLAGSTLSVLGEEPAWMAAWLEAEAASAAAAVEGLLYSEAGWGPGQALLLEEEGRPAWQAELWPPRGAEELVALVESQLSRLRFIPQPEAQQAFLEGVVAAVLSQARDRLGRELQQAAAFRALTSDKWLPRVCACVCFAHYVEVHLQELHDDAQVIVTRLMEGQQQAAAAAAHADAGAAAHAAGAGAAQQVAPPGATANGDSVAPLQQQQQQPPPLLPAAAADTNGGGAAAARLRLLARPLAEFGSLRREWVLQLGKAVGTGFASHAAGYVSGRGGRFQAGPDAPPSSGACGALLVSSGVVSGELQPALAWLSSLLQALSERLDKACFRQAWAAAAASINRELFNSVACEAIFSDAGVLQLAVDFNALLGVFGRFTPRPATHFRELGDALKLLSLQQAQAEFVKQAVAAATRAPNAAEVLKSVGVFHLEPQLADTVLALRMFR